VAQQVTSHHRWKDTVYTLMLDFGWQNWSQFGKVEIGLTGTPATISTTTSLNYHELGGLLPGEFHLGERRKPDSERNKLRGRLMFDQLSNQTYVLP
jgi:hypothetical protein